MGSGIATWLLWRVRGVTRVVLKELPQGVEAARARVAKNFASRARTFFCHEVGHMICSALTRSPSS
jgi:hypothetical protein